jgi:pimeloyl-ACP methyl ester carboxylesterase
MPVSAGLHYFVQRTEDSNRPPVILIHGAGGSYLTWHPYIRRLRDETVYTLDLPGHGQSEGAGRQSIEEYAEDVINFMDAENIQTAVLAGISMGSAIALTLVLDHPNRVAGLVLIGGGAKMPVAKRTLETIGQADSFEPTVEFITTNFFSASVSPDLFRLSKQGLLKTDPSILLGDFLACDQFDVTDRLSEVKIPTLILCGEKDRMMPPKFSEFLRNGIPSARLSIIKQAGHMAQLEQPRVVVDAIKQFLHDLPLHSIL